MKKVIIIPARLNSSRLPNKVILDLKGKTVIQRVYEQCIQAKGIDEVFIATDSLKVKTICSAFTDNIIMTSSEHQSGTDRIAQAVCNIDCDIVVNVQGDEPFIDISLIEQLANAFEKDTAMASAMHQISHIEDIKNPNVVKVITDNEQNAIYFSRSPIPFPRDEQALLDSNDENLLSKVTYYRHLGIYAYRKDFLIHYAKLQPSKLEQIEKLEQLRVLENGYKIKMVETKTQSLGIDTLDDYYKALEFVDKGYSKKVAIA